MKQLSVIAFRPNGSVLFLERKTHVAEPLGEGRGASEHGGLLGSVASSRGDEAGHTLHVPPAISAPAVQRPSGITLRRRAEDECRGQTDTEGVCGHYRMGGGVHTWQPETSSPPAQIMVGFTVLPHQPLPLQTLWPTTGRSACWSLEAMGPLPAGIKFFFF